MSRPTRPPGPPYPEEPYREEPYPSGPYPDEQYADEQYADGRRSAPPPTQPRFTPRPGPQPSAQQQQGPHQPGALPPAAPVFSPAQPPPPHFPPPVPPPQLLPPPASQQAAPPSAPRAAQPPPSPDAAPSQPVFTPKSAGGKPGGGRHGGRPRPSFTPREGYTLPDDRRRAASPPPTAFFSPAPAGYPQAPVPQEFGYAPATPRFIPVDPQAQQDEDNRTRILERSAEGARSSGPQRADNTSPNLARSSRAMALGTIASRGTGFLRTFVLVAALGSQAFAGAYNNANTLPNTVYYLMLGGIFTSVVVPLLVRSAKEDPDRGEAYAERIFTLGVVALLTVTLLGTLLAGPLVDLYAGDVRSVPGWSAASQHHLTILFAYFFIPQIFFYGMDSLLGAILNTRGRFGANMWTPVINNVVVIIVGALFILMEGKKAVTDPAGVPSSAIHVLAIGTTLGIVIQSIALFPVMRRAGFSMRLRWDLRRSEISEIGRMAGWMFGYVGSQALGNLVVQRIANHAGNYSAYSYAWQLFQLPYAIVGISVISALLPRMSGHANDRRYSLVRDDFSTGVRLASVIVVPAAIYLAVLGAPLCEFLFSIGANSAPDARYIGEVFGAFSLGLVPFMLTQLQLRVFYSFHENRTPAIIGMAMLIVGVVGDLIVLWVVPISQMVIGLAFAYDLVTLTGAVISWPLLLRRVGSLDGWRITRSLVRMLLATVPGLIFTLVITAVIGSFMHQGPLYGLVVTVVAGGGALALYAICCRMLGIEEFRTLMRSVGGRFG
jgi:putative peptidoglycan lipid II flippase